MGRREENKQKKRDRLLSEGLRLFREQGYDRASIEQVVAAADVARGTFYLYFPDKLALFEALIDRWMGPLLGILGDVHARLETASNRLESLMIYLEMAQRLTEIAEAHPDEVLVTFREVRGAGEAGDLLRRRSAQITEATVLVTEQAARKGLITTDDPRLSALVILGAVERLHYEWLTGGDLGDRADLPARVMKLFARTLELPII